MLTNTYAAIPANFCVAGLVFVHILRADGLYGHVQVPVNTRVESSTLEACPLLDNRSSLSDADLDQASEELDHS